MSHSWSFSPQFLLFILRHITWSMRGHLQLNCQLLGQSLKGCIQKNPITFYIREIKFISGAGQWQSLLETMQERESRGNVESAVWWEHSTLLCGGNMTHDCVVGTQYLTVWWEHDTWLCGGNTVRCCVWWKHDAWMWGINAVHDCWCFSHN